MKVSLVKYSGGISLGIGEYSFPIENEQVKHNQGSRIGCEMKGPISLKEYNEAFDLAIFAWGSTRV